MRQFSDKIKTQAERLQKLENYKKLCERRILDFDPQHALPITEEMIGQATESTRDPSSGQALNQDYKRQLALKEQDLVYAKQRAEKAYKECEYLRQELQAAKTGQNPVKGRASCSPGESGEDSSALKEQVRMLEEEKNALLDYIEESVNMTRSAVSPQKDGNEAGNADATTNMAEINQHRMTLNDLQGKIKSLQAREEELLRQNEDLLNKLSLQENKMLSMPTGRGEETFGNLPTALSARSPTAAANIRSRDSDVGGILSHGTLP